MVTEFLNLKKYIESETAINCIIGNEDTSQKDYIRITPATFTFNTFNKKVTGTNFPVELAITVDRNNTIGGLEALNLLIKKLNGFDYPSGSILQEEGTPEYTENNFIIKVIFNLKTIIQET